jgi:Fe-S-cluster containining protein
VNCSPSRKSASGATPPPSSVAAWQAWFADAGRQEVAAGVQAIYDRIDAAVAERRPICNTSGRCCHFESHGHRLYVTALEIAWFIVRLPPESRRRWRKATDIVALDGCVFQVDGLCSTHSIRPLGCRAYFCDPTTPQWQNELYETLMTDLRALHDRHGITYRYMEWRAGLEEARRSLG